MLPKISKPVHKHGLSACIHLLPQHGYYWIREQRIHESTKDRRHREKQCRYDNEERLLVTLHIFLVFGLSWTVLAGSAAAFYQGNHQGSKSDGCAESLAVGGDHHVEGITYDNDPGYP